MVISLVAILVINLVMIGDQRKKGSGDQPVNLQVLSIAAPTSKIDA